MRHTQKIVNAAPTAGEGARVTGMISALVGIGIEAGYLANPRLAKVHWQAAGRQLPPASVCIAGESAMWVDPAEIPADGDIGKLGQALAGGRDGERYELMANTAAYSGLRWGELTALTTGQIDAAARVITVDRKVIEVAGHLYVEAPKGRKYRKTVYPRLTPAGTPSPSGSPPASSRSAPNRPLASTKPDSSSPPPSSSCGDHPTSTATSSSMPTPQLAGATATATAGGHGTACGTSSAPPACSHGSSTPPTYPAWPGTPMSARPCSCTSAPPPASSTVLAKPPNSLAVARPEPWLLTDVHPTTPRQAE